MSSSRQPTLAETWTGRTDTPVTLPENHGNSLIRGRLQPRGQGRGRGASGKTTKSASAPGTSRGKRGTGGKRGRGRANAIRLPDNTVYLDDDDDDLCQALGQFELADSELAKALETGSATADVPGFDPTAGETWIYPTNRPVRDYQFNITETALFHNTLVSLPTGLGKTFIAAVVMYNFYRWYPSGIIVFMAPTRPLVTQQLDACHNIVGINPGVTVELTGQILPSKREALWKEKRVFFLTPQVIQSDIARNFCAAEKIRCIVIDEAHKAMGNHSYAQVISAVIKKNPHFRVLALSATPGNEATAVQQVLKNLLISRVEIRTEKSSDVLPYVHDRDVETRVVSLDPFLLSIDEEIKNVFQIYTGKLMQQKILPRNGSSMVSYQLLQARQRFRQCPPPNISQYERGFVEKSFFVCISLAKAIELLNVHGIRSFYLSLKGLFLREKGSAVVASELKKHGVELILERIQEKLHISVENSSFNISTSGLFDTLDDSGNPCIEQVPSSNIADYLKSHPKMKVLKDIVEGHFRTFALSNESTRVMIFSQYRDSVQEIGNLLSLMKPLVKPMVFMGQAKTAGGGGRGLKQKEQIQVVEKFKDGGFNVLVATSVGEEGLDIGDVDLIICFDSNKSPTRNIQRMGRTGRQRQGRIIFLLTEGREERLYRSSVSQQSTVQKCMDASKLKPFLYPNSPRMVPTGIDPQCFKMSIILSSEHENYLTRLSRKSVCPEDDTFEDFIRPANVGVKSKKNQKGNHGSKKADNNSKNAQVNTITKCIEKMESKQKVSADTITIDDEAPYCTPPAADFEYDLAMADDNHDFLCSIFDLSIINANTSAPPCVQIPLRPHCFKWKLEYNSLPDSILFSDIQTAKELVDTNIFVGTLTTSCKCGNPGSADTSLMQDLSDCFVDEFNHPFEDVPTFPNNYTKSPTRKSLSEVQLTTLPDGGRPTFLSLKNGKLDIPPSISLVPTSTTTISYKRALNNTSINVTEKAQAKSGSTIDLDAFEYPNTLTNYNSWNKMPGLNAAVETVKVVNTAHPSTKDNNISKATRTVNYSADAADESSTASESEFAGNISVGPQISGAAKVPSTSRSQAVEAVYTIKFKNDIPGVVSSSAASLDVSTVETPSFQVQYRSPPEITKTHEIKPSSVKRPSPDIGMRRKKFTFKKRTSTGTVCLSSISINEESVLNETIVASSQAGVSRVVSSSNDSEKFKYCSKRNYNPHECLTIVKDDSEIDFIPGTSSDEEEPRNINKVRQEAKSDQDMDSDATTWDPDELPPTPPPATGKFGTNTCTQNMSPQSIVQMETDFVFSPDRRNYRLASQIRNTLKRSSKPNPSSEVCKKQNLVFSRENNAEQTVKCAEKSSTTSTNSFLDLSTLQLQSTPHVTTSVNETISESEIEFLCSIPKSQNGKSTSKKEASESEGVKTTPPVKKFRFTAKSASKKCIPTVATPSPCRPCNISSPSSSIKKSKSSPIPLNPGNISMNVFSTPIRSVSFIPSSPDSGDFIPNRKKPARRMMISSDERPNMTRTPLRVKRKKKTRKNPFVLEEAYGTSEDSSKEDCDEENSVDDSFVVHGDDDDSDDIVSATQQQAMYLQSVRDIIPIQIGGRLEEPVPNNNVLLDDDTESYFNDSFCDDEVEYADVGVYTQAMNDARQQIEQERNSGKSNRRRLRSRH